MAVQKVKSFFNRQILKITWRHGTAPFWPEVTLQTHKICIFLYDNFRNFMFLYSFFNLWPTKVLWAFVSFSSWYYLCAIDLKPFSPEGGSDKNTSNYEIDYLFLNTQLLLTLTWMHWLHARGRTLVNINEMTCFYWKGDEVDWSFIWNTV